MFAVPDYLLRNCYHFHLNHIHDGREEGKSIISVYARDPMYMILETDKGGGTMQIGGF
jgi:hypothetical protein